MVVARVKVYITDDGTGWSITVTERQVAILQMLADGANSKAISDSLRISINTFKKDLTTVFQKLAAQDRTHAVAKAIRAGLIR